LILLRSVRKMTAERARDWRARAARLAQNLKSFCASALHAFGAFGVETAQFWRKMCVILLRFWLDFAARRAQNDRKTCARSARACRTIRAESQKFFARVRRTFLASSASKRRNLGKKYA